MTVEELIQVAINDNFSYKREEHKGKMGTYLHWDDPRNKDGSIIHVSDEALPDLTWSEIRSQAVGGRDVSQFSRIVGYFSRVDNWNPSKKGKLKDRQAGDYGVEK